MSDTHNTQSFVYCFYAILFLVGGGFLAIGLSEAHLSSVRYDTGLTAQGKVLKAEDEGNTDGDWTSYEVAFVAADRHTYLIHNHYLTTDNPKLYQVGQLVPVVYLPVDPEDGRIDSPREQYGVYQGCLVGALVAVLFGALIFYFFHRPILFPSPTLASK